MEILKKYFKFFQFFIPIAIWFYVFRPYFLGKPPMTSHGMDYYCIIKYHLDNLASGIYPQWDPYQFWGRPDNIDPRFVGEFNPFLWLYLVFSLLGFSLPLAFLLYAVSYFFIGLIGFYKLAKIFFRDPDFALISFVCLLFSSLIITVFNNYCVTLLFVPMVWFFYYLMAFSQKQTKHSFLGMTFSLMILAITYMPFYFLTILFPFLIAFGIFFFRLLPEIGAQYCSFIKKNWGLVVFCCVALIISGVPGWLWNKAASNGDYVVSWRHEGAGSHHSASMSIETIEAGGIVGPVTFQGLFSGLQSSEHLIFFIPVFLYLMIGLSARNKFNKRLCLLFLVGMTIFLVSLAEFTPVHKFLYKHVFFFQLFRNIFYFMYFLMPLVILFAIEQLRVFLEQTPRTIREKLIILFYVACVHLGFAYFLYRQEDVVVSSYVTVGLSLVFFWLVFSGFFRNKKAGLIFFLLCLLMLQPIEVAHHYVKNSLDTVAWCVQEKFSPRFSFIRRTRAQGPVIFKGEMSGIQDHSGFNNWKYTGLKDSFVLHSNINQDILERYTHFKFIVYDYTEEMDLASPDFKRLETAFLNEENTAFVDRGGEAVRPAPGETMGKAQIIQENSDNFQVKVFDVNSLTLKTNFKTRRFLVYTDSFDKNWKAFLNGKEVSILKANLAFKGLWLPAGENTVFFRYGSNGLYFLSYFLLIVFNGFFAYFVWHWARERFAQAALKTKI